MTLPSRAAILRLSLSRGPAEKHNKEGNVTRYKCYSINEEKQHCCLSCSLRDINVFPSRIFIGRLTFNVANITSRYFYSIAHIFII